MVFDITLCGDWAGNVYGLSGCGGGDCATRVMKGANFQSESSFYFRRFEGEENGD